MKFAGKAEEIAIRLIELFRSGNVPKALGQVFVRHDYNRHCQKWSYCNQLLVALYGFRDARTYKQWAEAGFYPTGEKAVYILAPLQSKREVEKNGVKEKRVFTYGFRGLPVFGDSQVRDAEGNKPEFPQPEFLNSLPLIEVAESWGIKVGAYNGNEKTAHGYFSPSANIIELGVENPSTFCHELIHAAEHRLGVLDHEKYKATRAEAEIVAELGGAVLLYALGMENEADAGGCWEYVQHYAKQTGKDIAEICYQLVNRISNAVKCILEEKEELSPESIEEKLSELQEIA